MASLQSSLTSMSSLRQLRSFTLSIHSDAWLADTLALLHNSPLEALNLYATHGATISQPSLAEFYTNLLARHAARLTRISIHRLSYPGTAWSPCVLL